MTSTSPCDTVVDRLRSLVKCEEARVRDSVPEEFRRLAFMELVRAIDASFIRLWLMKAPEVAENREELQWLYAMGINRALRIFLDDWGTQVGIPFAHSVRQWQEWADSVVQHCGRLGLCEFILGLLQSRLIECTQSSKASIRFRCVGEPLGMEWFERSDFNWWQSEVRAFQESMRTSLENSRPAVLRLMGERVGIWRDHFISYDSHADIDEYFDQQAILAASIMPGLDEFPPSATFGGIAFGRLTGAVGILLGWTLKHLMFVEELLKRHPHLEPRDVTTISCTCDQLVADISLVLDVDKESTGRIVDAITLKANLTTSLCRAPGDPPAPLIQVSRDQLLKSVCGCLGNPFMFLLSSLRETYRKDWDSAVDSRECAFRDDLYSMFPQSHIVKIPAPFKLKTGGRAVTDIDAALVNRLWGTVALFQLKWQDLFGYSMRQRESQKRNLLSSANKWIERVSDWICSTPQEKVAERLGLGRSGSIRQIRLFVLGRNAAHFSGEGEPDGRAAWGNWRQVQHLTAKEYDRSDPIEWLYEALKRDSPRRKGLPESQDIRIRVRDVEIILESQISGE